MNERQTVLIVEDEPKSGKVLKWILEDLVDLKLAGNGEEALNILASCNPDLVLLDITMPGIDGYQVCTKIRANPKLNFTKVILLSARVMTKERLRGYEVGADDYITKPFISEELLAKVKIFLRLTLAEKQLDELNRSLDEKVQERTLQLLETEAKLFNAAKMSALGEMTGAIAHEINTPLGAISIITEQVLELLNEETLDRNGVTKRIQTVNEIAWKISAIIKGLRTFSRDGSQDRFESVSLSQILDSTLTLCRERLKTSNIQLQMASIPDDMMIRCRAVQISQVLLNLITNACDAILPLQEHWIKISTERQGNDIEISVTDSGPGIPEKVRAKLFQRFFTTKGDGTGLGLSISKGIVDTHHGTLSIDASYKNTRFVLKLPSGSPIF